MKIVIVTVISLFAALAFSRPQSFAGGKATTVVTSHGLFPGELPNPDLKSNHLGRPTSFSYHTQDQDRSETVGLYTDSRVNHPLNRITGNVAYTTPEGQRVSYQYVADGSGYHVINNP